MFSNPTYLKREPSCPKQTSARLISLPTLVLFVKMDITGTEQ
jgi:hypothetical protein